MLIELTIKPPFVRRVHKPIMTQAQITLAVHAARSSSSRKGWQTRQRERKRMKMMQPNPNFQAGGTL